MCGVLGVFSPGHEAAPLAALGLFALQHRGQESAGVAVSDGHDVMVYKDLGLVAQVLDERRLPSLRGAPRDCPLPLFDDRLDDLGEQPADFPHGPAPAGRRGPQRQPGQHAPAARASCPAGAVACRRRPIRRSSPRCWPRSRPRTWSRRCCRSCRTEGAYALVVMDEPRVIGVRDPYGFRPLVLGRLPRRPDGAGRLGARFRDGRARHPGRGIRPRRGAGRDGRAGARRGHARCASRRGTSSSASSS